MHALNRGYMWTAVLAAAGFVGGTYWLLNPAGHPAAWWHFALCGVIGIATSIAVVYIPRYYTESGDRPVQSIAAASVTGPATNIIAGVAGALECTALPTFTISTAIIASYKLGASSGLAHAGLFGTAVATMGMLGTAAYILAMDTFGPITDNAGGIIEMSHQPEAIRKRTDRLDAVGNTTKALTKGYAIGSAALAAFLLFSAYLDEVALLGSPLQAVDISKPEVFVGGLLGAMLVFWFSALAIGAVTKAAVSVIKEVRRQFQADPGILKGTSRPDYGTAVDIVTIGALKAMVAPGLLAVAMPIAVGLFFKLFHLGAETVAAFLMVGTIGGILMATLLNNGGGAWDNAKKFIETGEYGGKGSPAHKARVVPVWFSGVACALAGLCYAELAAMIPQAGSAYAYSYATLGELVAWIIGWDLILEYAVGNVAVAISWGDYFTSLLRSFDFQLPVWLTTGYRTALLSPDPALHGLLQGAPHVADIPILVNLPAFVIVMLITWLLMLGVRESATANNIMVTIKLLVLGLFVIAGLTHLRSANLHPFAPNGFRGIHQGAAIVFFAYIGFDAISTAAEETKNPQRNLPIGILGGLAICTLIYMIVGTVLTGMVPYTELVGVADPLAKALNSAGFTTVGWIVALGAIVSMSAVLLVFQYGQPRIFFAMGRDGLLPPWAARVHQRTRVPYITTLITGIFVGLWSLIGDAGETYNLTNIGTLFAFVLVCVGVLVLRHTDRDRPRPFRVPLVWVVSLTGAALCVFVMVGLPGETWWRFAIWLAIGLALYVFYGFRHSRLHAPPSDLGR